MISVITDLSALLGTVQLTVFALKLLLKTFKVIIINANIGTHRITCDSFYVFQSFYLYIIIIY